MKKRKAQAFVDDCLDVLPLRLPLIYHVLKADETDEGWLGWHLCNGEAHIVQVVTKGDRHVLSLLAHEIVHAYVTENHPYAQNHGRRFRQYAKRLQHELANMGWWLEDELYMQGVDV